MPRILRIANRLNIGGPTYNVAYLTRYLPPEYETVLAAGQLDVGEGSSAYICQQLGVEPVYLQHMQRALNARRDRAAYREIRALIRQLKPEIVHTHAAKPGAVGRLAAAHEGVPAILHTFHGHVFHSYFGSVKTQAFLQVERYLARLSHAIVAISPLQKKELGEQYRIAPTEKIRVVPNGFDLGRFQENHDTKRHTWRERWGLAPDTVALGMVGRIVSVKNHPLFLQALALLKARTSTPFRALIVGDGEDRPAMEALARTLGLRIGHGPEPADVTFTSWETEMDVAMAGLDVVVLSSHNEGTPVSLVEAQAAGRALVSTEVGGVADVVLRDRSGLLTPPNDREALAHALQLLVEDPALRARLGGAGVHHVQEHFSYQRLCRNMAGLYRELLQGR